MADDTTGATIDDSGTVVVGKNNRQYGDAAGATIEGSVGNVGGKFVGRDEIHNESLTSSGNQTVTIGAHDDNEHAATIRLIYDLVAKLTGQIEQERKERIADMAELRREMNALLQTTTATQLQVERVGDHMAAMAAHWPQAVKVTDRHRWTFAAAFAMLFAPVPLFYSQVRDHVDIGWQAALAFAMIAYLVSALLWSNMWWGK